MTAPMATFLVFLITPSVAMLCLGKLICCVRISVECFRSLSESEIETVV